MISASSLSGIVQVENGGTERSTLTDRTVLVGRGTAAIDMIGPGTAGQPLLSGGAAASPAYVTPTAGTGLGVTTNATTLEYALTTPVTVANGGTGAVTHTANSVLIGQGTSAIAAVGPGTAGNTLLSGGAGVNPAYVAPTAGAGLAVTTNATTLSYAFNLVTTKGDLATYSTGPARLAVGANDTALIADSAQTTGLKYATSLAAWTATNLTTGNVATAGDGLTMNNNTGSYTPTILNYYEESTGTATFDPIGGGTTTPATYDATYRVYRIGKIVTLTLVFSGTFTASGVVDYLTDSPIVARFRPTSTQYHPILVSLSGSQGSVGRAEITSAGAILLYPTIGASSDWPNDGLAHSVSTFSVCWTI